ncbi:hypothetical protein AB0C18_32140 [Nonomuraea muscovyensis]
MIDRIIEISGDLARDDTYTTGLRHLPQGILTEVEGGVRSRRPTPVERRA